MEKDPTHVGKHPTYEGNTLADTRETIRDTLGKHPTHVGKYPAHVGKHPTCERVRHFRDNGDYLDAGVEVEQLTILVHAEAKLE